MRLNKMEVALHASEERLRLAIAAADMYTWEIDPGRGTFQAQNNERSAGIPMPTSLEEAWRAVHPDDLTSLQSAFEQAIVGSGEFQAEYRVAVEEDAREVWAFSAGKVIPATGMEPLRVVGVTQNITARKRAEESLRQLQAAETKARRRAELLAEAVSELETVDGFDSRARRLVELLVPGVADFAAVRMPDLESDVASLGEGETSIELPLLGGANLTGSLTLGFKPDRAVSLGDLQLAREVAEIAGLLLSNARLQEEEHRIARRLQRTLLPEHLIKRPEVAIAARYEAGSDGLDVGGDWYDSFSLPDGRIGLAVGDVVGTGLEAAAAMGRIRTALVALASHTESPGSLLTQLDEFVSGPNGSDFATACYAILDPATGRLSYASAAHPPILLLRPSGAIRWLEDGRSLPLGGNWEAQRSESSVTLEPGSLLVFYSDGLVERRGESLSAGLDRLERVVLSGGGATVAEVCERLLAELGAGPNCVDDIVVMCVRLVPVDQRPFMRSFSAQPEELGRLRAAVREWLANRAIAEQERFDVVLALGEATTNAVEHAYTDRPQGRVEVEVRDEGTHFHVHVQDFGTWKPPRESTDERVRGTGIIMQLSDDFRRETNDKGTTTSFSVPVRMSA